MAPKRLRPQVEDDPGPTTKSFSASAATATTSAYSSVVCRLPRVCRLAPLQEEIKRISTVMKQVQLEAWHLANIHVLRCLQECEPLPELTQRFFYRCCAATLGSREARDRDSSAQPKDPAFHQSCLAYWHGREQITTYAPVEAKYMSYMMNEMSQQMRINAQNMIALTFRRRLDQYVRFRYAKQGEVQLKKKDTKRLVDSCYHVREERDTDEHGNAVVKKVWTEWEPTKDPVALDLRAWLGMVPWAFQIRKHNTHFLAKLYDMQRWMEEVVVRHPRMRGTRLYSLLPVATSYQANYLTINASTLYGLLARIRDHPEVKRFLESELNIVATRARTSDSQRMFTQSTFQQHRHEILRRVFDVSQFETSARRFADEIKTDGYGASVLLTRPERVAMAKMQSAPRKRQRTSARAAKSAATPSRSSSSKANKHMTSEGTSEDAFESELHKLGPDYAPKVLVGIDPGMRSMVTAVAIGHLSRKRRRRKHEKVRRERQRRRRNRRLARGQRITTITTREYRHLARMNDFQFWYQSLQKREPWYRSIVGAMPSLKTARYEVYMERLEFVWRHLRFLLAFSAENAFLRWRFSRTRWKTKALDTLAKRIVPTASKDVCIAYGDWSRRDGIKGNASGPVKCFVRALQKRATVLSMDEYRTSKVCSNCHKRLRPARLFVHMLRKDGEVDVRLKARPTKNEKKEIQEMRKFRDPRLADRKIVLTSSRHVLRCHNSRCKAQLWNRDVNAARNILELLRSGLEGKTGWRRLAAFRRGAS